MFATLGVNILSKLNMDRTTSCSRPADGLRESEIEFYLYTSEGICTVILRRYSRQSQLHKDLELSITMRTQKRALHRRVVALSKTAVQPSGTCDVEDSAVFVLLHVWPGSVRHRKCASQMHLVDLRIIVP